MTDKANMMIITSTWGNPPVETFRLIPLTQECAYQEAIFDPASKMLALISKIEMQKFTMVPKLTDDGDLAYTKNNKPRPGSGKTYREERRLMDSYQEYYITRPEEILSFLGMFAMNLDKWNMRIESYLKAVVAPPGDITLEPQPYEMKKVVDEVDETETKI